MTELKFPFSFTDPARILAAALEENGAVEGCKPQCVAAALALYTVERLGSSCSVARVSQVAGVTQVTVKRLYKLITSASLESVELGRKRKHTMLECSQDTNDARGCQGLTHLGDTTPPRNATEVQQRLRQARRTLLNTEYVELQELLWEALNANANTFPSQELQRVELPKERETTASLSYKAAIEACQHRNKRVKVEEEHAPIVLKNVSCMNISSRCTQPTVLVSH